MIQDGGRDDVTDLQANYFKQSFQNRFQHNIKPCSSAGVTLFTIVLLPLLH